MKGGGGKRVAACREEMTEKYDCTNTSQKMEQAIELFIRTDRLHHSLFGKFISFIGLHRSQQSMLGYLCHQKQAPSQKQIAQEFEISPAAVAVTLKKLEKGGFIERNTAAQDNRYNEIRITPAGAKLMEETRTVFSQIDHFMFRNFTDEELETFMRCLNKMNDNLHVLETDVASRHMKEHAENSLGCRQNREER